MKSVSDNDEKCLRSPLLWSSRNPQTICMHTLQRPAHHVIARGLTPGCQLEASKEHVSSRRLSATPCSSCHVRLPPGAALHTEELPSLKRRLHAHDVPVCNALLIMSLLRPSHVATLFVKASHGALQNRRKDQRRRRLSHLVCSRLRRNDLPPL